MYIIKSVLLQLLAVLCFVSLSLAQESVSAKVVGVASGDSITVFTKDKRQLMIHISGVDAPEKEQDFNWESRQFLSDLVLNQTINVSNLKKDCIGRFAGNVTFKNQDVSLLVIKSGNAWADTSCQNIELLAQEELSAKEKKVGLWQKDNPIRPAEFRKQKQELEQVQAVTIQTDGRRIFTGLAPTPPPLRKGMYLGMTVNSFTSICGEKGEKSQIYTSDGYQSFSITIPKTKEDVDKGCSGSFNFTRTSGYPVFTLKSAFQDMQ